MEKHNDSIGSDHSRFSSEPPHSTVFQAENTGLKFKIQPQFGHVEQMSKTQDFAQMEYKRPQGVEVNPIEDKKRGRKKFNFSKNSANDGPLFTDTIGGTTTGNGTPIL